jgi:hypothetical protein
MLFEPPGKGCGASIGQQINGPMGAQIHQNSSIRLAASKRDIINARDAWCGNDGQGCPFRLSQQGIGTYLHTHLLNQTFNHLGTEDHRDEIKNNQEANYFVHLDRNNGRQSFHEGLLSTVRIPTPKTAYP